MQAMGLAPSNLTVTADPCVCTLHRTRVAPPRPPRAVPGPMPPVGRSGRSEGVPVVRSAGPRRCPEVAGGRLVRQQRECSAAACVLSAG